MHVYIYIYIYIYICIYIYILTYIHTYLKILNGFHVMYAHAHEKTQATHGHNNVSSTLIGTNT